MPIVSSVVRVKSRNSLHPTPTADEMPLDEWMYDPDTAIVNTHKYGVYVAITVEDYPLLRQAFDDGWKWDVFFDRSRARWDARLIRSRDNRREHTSLPKLFIGDGYEQYDHINHCILDNTRPNIRGCTRTQNQANTQRRNKSGYRGVVPTANGKWLAQINANRVHTGLGIYDDIEVAARVYDRAAISAFGNYATTNFPKEEYF